MNSKRKLKKNGEIHQHNKLQMDGGNVPPQWALRIPEVLENILKFVNNHDIKQCCLVSRTWWDACQRRRRAAVSSLKVSSYNGLLSVNSKPLPKFLKALKAKRSKDGMNMYGKFALQISFGPDKTVSLTSLWSTIGQNVTSLKLVYCDFPTIDCFRSLIFRTFPNMESLYIGSFNVWDKQVNSADNVHPPSSKHFNLKKLSITSLSSYYSQISWVELLENFPSLKKLEFIHSPGLETVQRAFSAINTIRQRDPDALQLSHICNGAVAGDALLQFIESPSIRLQSLSINIAVDSGEAALNRIFSSQSTSLSTLVLQRNASRRLDPITCFPVSLKDNSLVEEKLVNLQELTLMNRVFASIEFLRFMPNLRKLSMTGLTNDAPSIISATNIAFMKQVKLVHCSELEMDIFVPLDDLVKLVKWLPNVEKLKMSMDNDTFAIVCHHWPNLTSMEIVDTKVDECGFTGLQREIVDMVNSRKGNLPAGLKVIELPSVSCLKHLRKLSMSKMEKFPFISLSYAAAIFGIQKAPSLNYVDIQGISFNEKILLESFRKSVGSQQAYSRIVS